MHSNNLRWLQMFVLVRPQFIVSCSAELRSRLTSPTQEVTEKRLLDILSQHNGCGTCTDRSVLLYLEMFHVIELSALDRYRLTLDNIHSVLPMANRPDTRLLQFDFDQFLPTSMMNYLVCKLAQAFEAQVEVTDAHTAVLMCAQQRFTAYMQLDPYLCVASINVHGYVRLCITCFIIQVHVYYFQDI